MAVNYADVDCGYGKEPDQLLPNSKGKPPFGCISCEKEYSRNILNTLSILVMPVRFRSSAAYNRSTLD